MTSRPAPSPLAADEELLRRVATLFRHHTSYPEDVLSVDADLEADLGIDSITLAGILADLAREFGLDLAVLRAGTYVSVREVAERVAALGNGIPSPHPPTSAPPGPSVPVEASASRADRTNGEGQGMAERVAALLGRPLDPGRSFRSQGLSRGEEERILSRLADRAGVSSVLRLGDCDTVEKLEAFERAARFHEVLPLDGGSPVRQGPERPVADRRTMADFHDLPDQDLFAKARAFHAFLRERERENLYWYGMPLETPCTNRVVLYDELAGKRREFLMMASNSYLGLTSHPRVVEAIRDAARRYGATNTGCRLIGGTNVLHRELERRLARFKGTESAIVFPSGYSANVGTISALARKSDLVLLDKYDHMSIVDGAKLSGAAIRIFGHDDMADLGRILERLPGDGTGKLVVTDGVFSMHGDIANLPEIVRLARSFGARVLVDDAHATGVLGRTGSGTSEHYEMKGEVDLELGTFSKTLAGVGGFVCAREEVVEYLRYYANSYVFAATIPAPVAAGLIAALEVMESEPERIDRLWKNIHAFKGELVRLGFDVGGTQSAIIPIVIGDHGRALEMGRAVRARGLFCQTVVYPGVASGEERLRISLSSEHTPEDLDLAIRILAESAVEVGLPLQG